MSPSLQGALAKLARGREHVGLLERGVHDFLEAHPSRVVIQRPSESLYVLCLDDPPTIPSERWALMIGDCVHNLRSALDYVAWELAGADPGDRETQFPIFETRAGWERRGRDRIRRLPLEARSIIQDLQPFQNGRAEWSALNGLRKLDDSDKHKLLTVTAPVAERLFFHTVDDALPTRWNLLPDPIFSQGAILATLVFESDRNEPVVPDAGVHPMIAFGPGVGLGDRIKVVPTLENMALEVARIIELLKGFFPEEKKTDIQL